MEASVNHQKDPSWLIRTYSGYATAKESNLLYRSNLAKGQTGLSIAFDLPTQMGYDSDDALARGEVGKLGVPVRNHEDMMLLFDQIPIEKMNTSMTVNATTAWMLALYAATAHQQGADISKLTGTTQNDIVKEYLSRGTYIFPPKASMRLSSEVISYTVNRIPKWNPINICSYHLQEAGATPVQEIAFTLANAIGVLDAVKESGYVKEEDFQNVVGRISFFLNAGIRFIEEICKVRVFTGMWNRICKERYNVNDPKMRRFRYGVQVNSLCLTSQQPENNIARIAYEFLGVVMSKDARARSVQLPAWNEALGLPRKWDQQWSLRLQQIMALETDLLEYEDIFKGSEVIMAKEKELEDATQVEMAKIQEMGGVIPALESGYMKQQLVESYTKKMRRIELGEQIVVGVNKFTESEPSPLTSGVKSSIYVVDDTVESEQIRILNDYRKRRDKDKVSRALDQLRDGVRKGKNILEISIECAKQGVTTGEWGSAMREIFGEYRAPTGIGLVSSGKTQTTEAQKINTRVREISKKLGRNLKMLVAKPGLDGHSNGAEQIAIKARDVGMEVVYEGIRLTPKHIAESAMQEGVHVVGLSILSGSHMNLVPDVLKYMEERGIGNIPVVLGGIIPENDIQGMFVAGVKKVYTPSDFDLNQIMMDIVDVVVEANHITPHNG
jgi:(2R)-ethylmalonyl-CoA mutase